MDYSRKNPKKGESWRHKYFFENNPGKRNLCYTSPSLCLWKFHMSVTWSTYLYPRIFHFFFKINSWNFNSLVFNTPGNWAIPEKSKQWGWGNGISRSIEEKACRNSRGQLKRSGIFRGVPEKIMWNSNEWESCQKSWEKTTKKFIV